MKQQRRFFSLKSFLCYIVTLVLLSSFTLTIMSGTTAAREVVVETTSPGSGPSVTRDHKYRSMVTLYIENTADQTRTPSGWSTRKEDGAPHDKPFEFQPGKNLIQGWTEGVLRMREGERALLHVPSSKGYGGQAMGAPGGAFYIPANSDLLFDIEILGKAGAQEL